MNDKIKLVKEAKNDKASRCCWSAYKKRLGKMGLGEMGLGEMQLGEMLPNHFFGIVTFFAVKYYGLFWGHFICENDVLIWLDILREVAESLYWFKT